MKRIMTLCAALAALAACTQHAPVVSIIPQPNHIETGAGTFDLAGAVIRQDAAIDVETARLIADFAAGLTTVTGQESRIVTDDTTAAGLRFRKDAALAPEEYLLDCNADGVEIQASAYNGFLYALQSLSQLLPVEFFAKKEDRRVDWSVPYVSIQDKPRFAYRGFMLDVGRHFFPTEEVKKLIDVMSLHKLNKLHWHLTEDQGWRVEIKKYPKLTEIGAYRDGTMIGRYPAAGEYVIDTLRYGGFYTQDELRDVVAYAEKAGITIIPEIDLPGHMMAALASYPELGCTGGPYEVRKIWGICDEVLCPGKEGTFRFIEDVLTELMDIFPSEYIHIGGDECVKTAWKNCPDCQRLIKELGLKDTEKYTKEQELQNYVTARVQQFLQAHGRKLIGWDEILEGNLVEKATIMSWRGIEGGIEAASRGFDAIMSPTSHNYFDYYQTANTETEPLAIGGCLPIDSVYAYSPLKGVPEEAQRHILGVQANLWTEYIARPDHLEYMALPRMDALSEVQWCEEENKDFGRFKTALGRMAKIYDILGYTYCKEVFGEHGLPGVPGGTN